MWCDGELVLVPLHPSAALVESCLVFVSVRAILVLSAYVCFSFGSYRIDLDLPGVCVPRTPFGTPLLREVCPLCYTLVSLINMILVCGSRVLVN